MFALYVFLLLNSAFSSTSSPEVLDAKKSIETLITPLIQKSKLTKTSSPKKFRIDRCEKYRVNWTNVLLMKETAILTYHFKEGCDVDGSFTPKVFQPFSVSLKLRNLESYKTIDSINKITASFESKPILTLEMREGLLAGQKGVVRFEADYQVQIDPMEKKNPIHKNLGGELRITEIYGKKTLIKEKIKVE